MVKNLSFCVMWMKKSGVYGRENIKNLSTTWKNNLESQQLLEERSIPFGIFLINKYMCVKKLIQEMMKEFGVMNNTNTHAYMQAAVFNQQLGKPRWRVISN